MANVKPVKSLVAYGINGMNNLRRGSGHLLDDTRHATPRLVLNTDVFEDGRGEERQGYKKVLILTDAHSGWRGSVTLCVQGETLYRIDGLNTYELADISGPKGTPMHYVEVDGVVYMGNGFWQGAYDISTGAVREWGLPLPPMPEVTSCSGNLPEGRYSICYTFYDGTRLGGNGDVIEISWHGGYAGVKFLNRPADTLCWMTQPNGETLQYVTPNGNDEITDIYFGDNLPTLDVIAPPKLKNLQVNHGRIWGSSFSNLWYSEPFQYEWFKGANVEPFGKEIIMVAAYHGGIYVNSMEDTWAVDTGSNPLEWSVKRIGDGAIPGTLTYGLVEGGGYEISRKLSQLPSPLWMDGRGVVVGTATGQLVHLSETKLRVNRLSTGAAMFRSVNGHSQIVVSLTGRHEYPPDVDTSTVFRNGKLH